MQSSNVVGRRVGRLYWPKFFSLSLVPNVRPWGGWLMLERMKLVWYKIALYGIVVGLALALSGCGDFKKDFLCRPDGHCVNAPDGGSGSEA